MSILEYNLRIIIFHLIVIAGAIWIFVDWINDANTKLLRTTLIVLIILLVCIFIFSLLASIAYRNNITTTGTIVDITHTGSLAGLMDSYSVCIKESNGNVVWYNSSIFSSNQFKKTIENLNIGTEINLYANNFLNFFYKFEIVNRY